MDVVHRGRDHPARTEPPMLESLHRPQLEDLETPAEFSPEWHQQQEHEERAWLDNFARAQHLVTAA